MKTIYVPQSKLEWIASKSFINCHAIGVNSVLFDDTPGARVRAFVATRGHELWRNKPASLQPLSVAIHTHHCDVELVPVSGQIFNMSPVPFLKGPRYRPYKYNSPIKGQPGWFAELPELFDYRARLLPERLNGPKKMKAYEQHTVYVRRDEEASWFVLEGAEDPEYHGICWSDDDLTKFDFSLYYKPMTVLQVVSALHQLNVRII
jgi:hypothetical protein